MAGDARCARSAAESRQMCDEDGWQDLDIAKIRRVLPVESLELQVAPRAELNRPRFGFVRVGDTIITWDGPHDGLMPPRASESNDEVLIGTPLDIRVPSRKLWSFVWSPRELMLLTAMDFDTACVRAKRFRFSWKGRSVADLIEPIARFELQLAKGFAGYAPTCFRLWIDGHKVGWPPTEDQEPRRSDPPPGTPLAAEARLPIPEYAHTYAYGPGPRRKHGRRLDIPWPHVEWRS